MKTSLAVLCLAMLGAPAFAATPQQEKIKSCNADATKQDLQGEAHTAFLKTCLEARQEAKEESKEEKKAMTPQRKKMKTCNAKAKGLKGDEFKKVRNECLRAR